MATARLIATSIGSLLQSCTLCTVRLLAGKEGRAPLLSSPPESKRRAQRAAAQRSRFGSRRRKPLQASLVPGDQGQSPRYLTSLKQSQPDPLHDFCALNYIWLLKVMCFARFLHP